MANLICSYDKIGYTVLQYALNPEMTQELIAHPGKHVLGYVTYNSETDQRKFIYTESGVATKAPHHWSLDILKQFPYCESTDSWIIFNCAPHKARVAFQQILYGEAAHIDKWDIWSVEGKDDKVAVVTDWEIY